MQQVLASATKAYYSDKSFYRYRMDRDGSSIHSVHCLEYSYQEFQWLLDTEEMQKKIVCKKGLYRHMMQSFVGELKKTAGAVGYDPDSEYIRPHYKWFKTMITENCTEFYEEFCAFRPDLSLILNDLEEYCKKLQIEDTERDACRAHILKVATGNITVIFGAGAKGMDILQWLCSNDIENIVLADNDSKLWGQDKAGILIVSPEECVQKNPDAVYIVANKMHSQEIKEQLLQLGVEDSRISIYN